MPKAVRAAVAAVTKMRLRLITLCGTLFALSFVNDLSAAMLPDDRADFMYHNYNGDGLNVGGPSVLVRKSIADKVSVWGNYYIDSVTSASIDVVTTASEYSEQRDQPARVLITFVARRSWACPILAATKVTMKVTPPA